MPGTIEDAREAVALANDSSHYNALSFDGCTRVVYLINGVVYKVNRSRTYDDNMFEWNNYNRLRSLILPNDFRIPNMSVFDVGETVIAADFIPGEPTGECLSDGICNCFGECLSVGVVNEVINVTGLVDICYGNVIHNSDGFWLIDIAC